MEWTPVDATHAAVIVIEFSDGGAHEETVIHKGSEEACDQVARSLPAVSYNGDRPVKGAFIGVYPLREQDDVGSGD